MTEEIVTLKNQKLVLPALPLRDIVVFPGMVVPLFVGREKSIASLTKVADYNNKILLATQKNGTNDSPKASDIHKIGVIANVLQLLRLPDGTVKVLVEGANRVKIASFHTNQKFFAAECVPVTEKLGDKSKIQALARSVLNQFEEYTKLNKKIPPTVKSVLEQIQDPLKFANTVATHLAVKLDEKQKLLEEDSISKKLEMILALIAGEISILNTESQIKGKVKKQMEKNQREYYLNEQMKVIQKELHEAGESEDELAEIDKKIKKVKLSKEARTKATAELKKLRQMSPMAPDATVIKNYLDWMLSIPWKKKTRLKHNLKEAEKILNRDHYGLEKIKERIIEYLAVQERTNELKGQILCLVGPPGVGKTSLAKSIAHATGRNFVRMSLGGVRDEAEIRGHRRTYIGSLPGKIIQSMKKAKSSNPLFLLDEIDKMGFDHRGDPASALLEVLDPEQNNEFNDHYLEVDYDLSDVMFVTTANTSNMPRPLLDRMEIIRLSGYTEEEKIKIAEKHLIEKQRKAHGLKKSEFGLSEKNISQIIRNYTRESGVRNLEREIAKLARKTIKAIMMQKVDTVDFNASKIKKFLGVEKYSYGEKEKENRIGMTTGLAYTETGGDILLIESVTIPGKGKVYTTGKLGDVMKESVQAAWSYVRSRGYDFGIKPEDYAEKDIHVHVPEGATPKDGPSAGIAICTSIVSVLTGTPVKNSVAMTGEITLRGLVLPIGGLKEKLLAALRGGIKTVLIPKKNVKDLAEIPQSAKKGLDIIPVETVDEVIENALISKLKPIDAESLEKAEKPVSSIKDEIGEYVKH